LKDIKDLFLGKGKLTF